MGKVEHQWKGRREKRSVDIDGGEGGDGKGGSEVTRASRGMGKATCMYIYIYNRDKYILIGDRRFSFFSSFIIFFLFSSFVASFFAVSVYFYFFLFSFRGQPVAAREIRFRECTRSRAHANAVHVYT